jgi:hypothetical protein
VTVPVVWVSYRKPSIISRGYWDQGLLERILDRRAWRPPAALEYSHHDGFAELPADADGAVVVVPAQHHHLEDEVARLNADLAELHWVVLVLTGDECSLFPWRRLEHPNMRLWVMTPRPRLHEACEATFIGEGYHSDVPEILAQFAQEAHERPVAWFFAGQVTHGRRRQLVAFLRQLQRRLRGDLVETPGFLQGVEHRDYLRRMAMAKVAPCPSGPGTPDSFRAYEALEAGCLPLVDAVTPEGWEGYWPFVYGEVPFPIVDNWRDVAPEIENALAGWPANANRAFTWWQQHKRSMSYRLDDDVREVRGVVGKSTGEKSRGSLADLITVLMPTSPIPLHPSTEVIEETLASVRAQLPDVEVLVMADGVRAEQAERRADYEEYLRRLLWITNQSRNVLPMVMDDHQHQANLTRRALDLVRTPLVLFVEHDTPLCGDIPWAGLAEAVASGKADLVRLHHEALVLEPHEYLMVDQEPQLVAGVPMLRTAQWSQRPHLASAAYYRRIIGQHFPPTSRTMIEDRMHGIVATPWHERGLWGPHKLWMYAPAGDMKRSLHLDGRGEDPKFEMVYS